MASRADIEAGRAFVRLFLKNDMASQLTRALKTAQTKLRNFGRSARMMGRRLAISGVAMSAPFALAARTFARFDDAMRKVEARSRGTAKEMEKVRKQAKELGRTTVFTAVHIGELQAILGRRGFTRLEILSQTPGVVAFARAAGEGKDLFEDLGNAATLTAGAIRAWDLDASESMRIADLMTASVNNSALSMYTLGESLGYIAPLAAQSGYDLQSTLQVLGELSNIWIEGSRAGTTFRRMMINLATTVKKLTGRNIEVTAESGSFRDLGDIIKDIDEATKGLSKPARLAVFSEIFGARAITGAAGLSRTNEATENLRAALDNAKGSAERTAQAMDAGLGGAFRRVWSVTEGVRIAIGEALSPTLMKLSKVLITIMQSSIEWIKANKGLVVMLAATAAGVTALGVALMGIGAAAFMASLALGGLATIVSVVLSPLGLITAAVVGASVAFFKWTEAGQSAYRSLSSTLGKLLDRFREVFAGINDALQSGNVALAFDIMKKSASLALAEIAARVTYVFRDLIPGLALAAFSGLAGAWGVAVGSWQEPIFALWDLFKVVALSALKVYGVNFKSNFRLMGDLFTALWELFGRLGIAALKLVTIAFGSEMQLAVDISQALWKAFKGFGVAASQSWVASFINSFIVLPAFIVKTLAAAYYQSSRLMLESLIEGVTLWATFAYKVARGVGKVISDALQGKMPTAITGLGAGTTLAMEGMGAFGTAQMEGVAEAIKLQGDIVKAALSGLTGKPGDFGQVVKDFGTDVASAVAADTKRISEAAQQQLVPAVKKFSEDISQAVLEHAERIKVAGLDAAKLIGPAARRLAEVTKGMSKEVKAAFLERFQSAFAEVKDYKDPKAVSALRETLDSLIAEAAGAKGAAVGAAGVGGPVAAGGGGGPLSATATSAVPRGVALTATYSAAAARIAGFQAGGPEKKMADGIMGVNKNTRAMLMKMDESRQQMEQFLAGWRVG